jgi:hypothetical protein
MAPASSDRRAHGERRSAERRSAVLSRSTLMMIRRVLHAYREGWLLEERLAAAARMVAEDARLHGLPAARMLVVLKREWAALDDVRQLAGLGAQELLSRLVLLSIPAYYARERPAGGVGRGAERAGHRDARGARDAA